MRDSSGTCQCSRPDGIQSTMSFTSLRRQVDDAAVAPRGQAAPNWSWESPPLRSPGPGSNCTCNSVCATGCTLRLRRCGRISNHGSCNHVPRSEDFKDSRRTPIRPAVHTWWFLSSNSSDSKIVAKARLNLNGISSRHELGPEKLKAQNLPCNSRNRTRNTVQEQRYYLSRSKV
jgi:hypothetical protein